MKFKKESIEHFILTALKITPDTKDGLLKRCLSVSGITQKEILTSLTKLISGEYVVVAGKPATYFPAKKGLNAITEPKKRIVSKGAQRLYEPFVPPPTLEESRRPGCMNYLALPSVMSGRRVWPDGRVELL